jgi:hypothetical protein
LRDERAQVSDRALLAPSAGPLLVGDDRGRPPSARAALRAARRLRAVSPGVSHRSVRGLL